MAHSVVASALFEKEPIKGKSSMGLYALAVAAGAPLQPPNKYQNGTVAVIGVQWGDEGKGKLVDILSQNSRSCVRYNGGANAGHTLVVNGNKLACHLVPCGILSEGTINYVGNGVVVHLPQLAEELDAISKLLGKDIDDRLRLSSRTHLTFQFHMAADAAYENSVQGTEQMIGTTKRGIGPTYAAKALRISMRCADLTLPWDAFVDKYNKQLRFFQKAWNIPDFNPEAEIAALKPLKERFAKLVCDPEPFVETVLKMPVPEEPKDADLLQRKWRMVIEAANATMLDLDVGTYPYCTSSNTTINGVGTGVPLSVRRVDYIVGVAKAYCTRVGEGPFPSELHDELGTRMRDIGGEYGATTKRPRRCGWFDAQVIRYAHFINQLDCLMITKLDVLTGFEELKVCVGYADANGNRMHDLLMPTVNLESYVPIYETYPGWKEDITSCKSFGELPENAKQYLRALEKISGVRVKFVGVGPDRAQIFTVPEIGESANE